MAGRRPKPTALKKLTGNPGHRALPKNEPAAIAGAPECPAHLDVVARAEWDRIAPELVGLRILSRIDRAALAAYCVAWSRWIDAENKLRKFGPIINTPSGYPVQNPYLGVANTSMEFMRKFLVEFGMTPSSRSRIATGKEQGPPIEDEWSEFNLPTVN